MLSFTDERLLFVAVFCLILIHCIGGILECITGFQHLCLIFVS